MKTVLLWGLCLLTVIANGAFYRTKQPIVYQGQVYAALLNLNEADTVLQLKKVIAINFYLLKPEKGNIQSFESFGGYGNVKRVFMPDTEKEFKLIPELSTPGNSGFCRFTRCLPDFSKDKIEVVLSEFRQFNNYKINFYKIETNLNAMNLKDFISDVYQDEIYVSRVKNSKSLDSSDMFKEQIQINFSPRLAGNIDSKEFPMNKPLLSFLHNNSDFVFKVSKNLYFDILRFKANMFEYDKEKIYIFLKTYDLWFVKYQSNQEVLEKKIIACTNLLKKAAKLVNLGDIFYKEFPIYPRDVDLNSCKFEFVMPNLPEGYTTKKIIGEEDAFYLANGLNIYLSNWGSMKSLNLSEAQTHPFLSRVAGNPKPVTFRVYFLLQPFPVFSEEGEFKGITAYGLKSMLYNPCSPMPLLQSDNNYMKNISDTVVKRCYVSSVSYLNKYFSKNGCNVNVYVSELYSDNFIEMGNWHQPFPNCEVGYVFLAGKVKKASDDMRVLCFRMMTNYKTTFQLGNKVTFKNDRSGFNYSLPITEASIKLTGNKGGYYNLEVKIPIDVYKKILISRINTISFQCLGDPEFLIEHDFFYYNPNEELSTEVEELNTTFSVNSDGDAPKLEAFLKMGL